MRSLHTRPAGGAQRLDTTRRGDKNHLLPDICLKKCSVWTWMASVFGTNFTLGKCNNTLIKRIKPWAHLTEFSGIIIPTKVNHIGREKEDI